jgi:hypothetical protein
MSARCSRSMGWRRARSKRGALLPVSAIFSDAGGGRNAYGAADATVAIGTTGLLPPPTQSLGVGGSAVAFSHKSGIANGNIPGPWPIWPSFLPPLTSVSVRGDSVFLGPAPAEGR